LNHVALEGIRQQLILELGKIPVVQAEVIPLFVEATGHDEGSFHGVSDSYIENTLLNREYQREGYDRISG